MFLFFIRNFFIAFLYVTDNLKIYNAIPAWVIIRQNDIFKQYLTVLRLVVLSVGDELHSSMEKCKL
jgi:hypothetical protein